MVFESTDLREITDNRKPLKGFFIKGLLVFYEEKFAVFRKM